MTIGPQQRVRVVIADARQDVREALGALLDTTDEFDVVGYAATPQQAEVLTTALTPDIVIVDPDGRNEDCVSRLVAGPSSVVILTLNISPAWRRRAGEIGIVAIVDKGASPEQILDILRDAGHHEHPPVADGGHLVDGAASA